MALGSFSPPPQLHNGWECSFLAPVRRVCAGDHVPSRRELLLGLFCDLSSGTARTGGKSKSRGIAIQGQVSTPCKPTEPALANHVTPTIPFLLDPTQLLVQAVRSPCARARPVEDAPSTSVSCRVLLPGEGQLGGRRGKGRTSGKWRVPPPTGVRAPRGQTPPVSTTNFSNAPLHQQSDLEWAASPSSVSVTSPGRGDRDSNLTTKGGCEH